MRGLYAVRPELLFAINLALDLALLWFAVRIAWVRPRWWRLWLASVLGAGLSVLPAVLPAGSWLVSAAAVLAASLFLVLLVVWPASWAQFAAVFGAFWTGLALAGGLLKFLAERYASAFASPSAVLVASGVGLTLVGLQMLWQAYRERGVVDDGLYELRVRLGQESVILIGLLDSGNHLRTLAGRWPVAVVEGERLRPHLPIQVMDAAGRGWEALDALPAEWRSRCQVVPYAVVGRGDGTLLVLRPDGLAIRPRGGGAWAEVGGRIGLATEPLDPEGRYQALLPGPMLATAGRAPAPGEKAGGRSGERGEERPDVQVR